MILYLIAAMLSGTAATDHRFDIGIDNVVVSPLGCEASGILSVLATLFIHVHRRVTLEHRRVNLLQALWADAGCRFDEITRSKRWISRVVGNRLLRKFCGG